MGRGGHHRHRRPRREGRSNCSLSGRWRKTAPPQLGSFGEDLARYAKLSCDMAFRPLDRAALIVRRDHTLGTIIERLAKVNGSRQMVEEAGGGLRLTYAQAAKRVNR